MTADHLTNIEQFDADLWKIADGLRASALEQQKNGKLGRALTTAMEDAEKHFTPLAGQLLKDYERFAGEVLESMMRKFDTGMGTGGAVI